MRIFIIALLIGLISACASAPPPAPPPVEEPPAVPKIGIVGFVQRQETRAITPENWKEALIGIVRNNEGDKSANVTSVIWEVTLFYESGAQEMLKLDYDPQLRPGQRVRVTGKKIEILPGR